MDISFIVDIGTIRRGFGRLYQGAAPDDGITKFQTETRRTMLIEMAAGINALAWVRQGTIKSCLYFGIDDSPAGCLEDRELLSLARVGRAWLEAGDVLSACAAGVSRSSYCSCAILMATCKISFDDALATVRAARPQANPNQGFVDQLRRLEPAFKFV